MNQIRREGDQFYIGESLEEAIAKITFYEEGEGKVVIDRTYVSDVLKGQGAGGELVEKVVEMAKSENKKIVPLCSFANYYLTKTDEYRDILTV